MKQINAYINEKLRLTTKRTYTCQPKSKIWLRNIIIDRIKDEGPNCDLNDIDTSKIKDMSYLFDTRNYTIFEDFNVDISQWDVSNVIYMQSMFYRCKKFNCDLSKWNVSNVEDMGYMFCRCEKFDCDLSMWNVLKVEYIPYMFYECKKFNQDLDSWNISNVKEMGNAFKNCPTQPDWYDKKRWEPQY